MQHTLISEERLRELLEPLRNTPVPALDGLLSASNSARTHRTRWPVAVATAVALVAAAAAGYRWVTPYGDSAPPPICDRAEVVSGSAATRRVNLQDLPPALLLGWPDRPGITPTDAYAREDIHSCAPPPVLRLIALTGSVVTATIDLTAFRPGGSPAAGPDASPPAGEGTGDNDRTAPRRLGSHLVADITPGDGFSYYLDAEGVPLPDVESLLRSAVVHEGVWNIDAWAGKSHFDLVRSTGVDSDGLVAWWMLERMGSGQDASPSLSLYVVESADPVLLTAARGDRTATVAGQPALQSPDGTVAWQPAPGVKAFLSGDLDPEAMRARAAAVAPLDAGDPRLSEILR